MNIKEAAGKFSKGALSGGGAAIIAFLATNTTISNTKEFWSAVGIAFLSGAFHAIVNIYNQSKTTPV